MSVFDVIFFALSALTLLSAFVVAGSRNIVYSGFALIFAFLGVAGLYVQLSADFLAAMQVLVYVGGITVVILFAVMLFVQMQERLVRDLGRSRVEETPVLHLPLWTAYPPILLSLLLLLIAALMTLATSVRAVRSPHAAAPVGETA